MSTIPSQMRRIAKGAGTGNIYVEEVSVPAPGPRQVLIHTQRTLISRGSEIGGRYRKGDAIRPDMIGYSAAGKVAAVGRDVTEYAVGQRVAAVAPHAEYVIGDVDAIAAMAVTPIPDHVSFEQAVFHPLAVGAVLWTQISKAKTGESVVVMGQGLVGSLVLQALKEYQPDKLIAVDAIESRCERAKQLGADVVINARSEDPVARVRRLTDGEGAHLVMECVGGPPGTHSFPLALEMTRRLGRLHLISLYHEQPLLLDSSAMQQRTIVGGYFVDLQTAWRPAATKAMEKLSNRDLEVDALITHRFPPSEARSAFTMLHDRVSDAFGVVFEWAD